MAFEPITNKLPENWTANQIISPNGTEAGYDESYGYNYLMQTVNKTVDAVNELGENSGGIDEAIAQHNADKEAHPYLISLIQSLTSVIASAPTQTGTLVYSGSEQSPEWSGYDEKKMTIGGVTTGTDAGTYTATFTPIDPYKWADGTQDTKTATWEINRATISAAPTQSNTLTYTGNAQSPTWSGYDTAKMTAGGTLSGTNAGAYNAVFTATDNYQWDGGGTTKNVAWSIGKAEGSMSLSATSLTLSGAVGVTGTITVTREGDGAVVATSSDESVCTVSTTGLTVTVAGVGDGTATVSISVAEGTNYAAAAAQAVSVSTDLLKVFGVCWTMSNSSTALSRLTAANDPNGLATVTISTEPSPAVGAGSGSSPFDSYAPWRGMDEYNVISNAVSYKKGESGFSRSNDTVVYIPPFWYKVVNDSSNEKRYFYISDKERDGFTQHPGSGRYVGRYNTSSGYVSQTGQSPLASITREKARAGSTGKGAGWYEYDYASWCAVGLLYLVEFADWDSQSMIGHGVCDADAIISSGGTDSMVYHTGRASGTDGATAVQYRHIENPWGNVFEWIDGAYSTAASLKICTDPTGYADISNYTLSISKTANDGYISGFRFDSDCTWAFSPSNVYGSATTYVADYTFAGSGNRDIRVGGLYTSGSRAGLFCFYADSSGTDSGARLLFIP